MEETLAIGTIVLRREDNFVKIVLVSRAPALVVNMSLVYPRSFSVEFKDNEINIVPILPYSYYSFFTRLVYIAEEGKTANIIIAFHNYSQVKLVGNASGLPSLIPTRPMVLILEPRAFVFQIGPQAYLLLVGCENDA